MTDYVGYNHFRSPKAYGSCERFRNATVTEGSDISSVVLVPPRRADPRGPGRAGTSSSNAGYVDGHVESYSPADAVPMRVILRPETGEPYPTTA